MNAKLKGFLVNQIDYSQLSLAVLFLLLGIADLYGYSQVLFGVSLGFLGAVITEPLTDWIRKKYKF